MISQKTKKAMLSRLDALERRGGVWFPRGGTHALIRALVKLFEDLGGELRADGQLKITGRTKELFKTAKGKYVAPAPIESLLLANPMIEQAMVSGVGPCRCRLEQLLLCSRWIKVADDDLTLPTCCFVPRPILFHVEVGMHV